MSSIKTTGFGNDISGRTNKVSNVSAISCSNGCCAVARPTTLGSQLFKQVHLETSIKCSAKNCDFQVRTLLRGSSRVWRPRSFRHCRFGAVRRYATKKIGISHCILVRVVRKPCQKNMKTDMRHFQSKALPNANSNTAMGWTTGEEQFYVPLSLSTMQNHHHAPCHKCIVCQNHMYLFQPDNRQTWMGLEYFVHFL